MTIDFSQVITAEDKAAQSAEARASAIKNECGRRITAVLDERTVQNLTVAQIMGSLTADQKLALVDAEAWKWDMIEECRAAIAEGRDPVWTDAPAGVVALAEAF